MKNTVLKICASSWSNESRDKRELSACIELGLDVCVLAKGFANDHGREEKYDGFQVYRYGTKPLGDKVPSSLNRILSIFTWAYFARKIDPCIISGHDLPGLSIAWISTWFKKNKPRLVYDSHEFELGRNVKRSKVAIHAIKLLEKFLISKSAITMVVNDSIADEIQSIYKLCDRPLVIRNIPNYWAIDEVVCDNNREIFIKDFSLKGNRVDFLVIYHGIITSNRGIENIISAISKLDGVGLLLLGDYDSEDYREEIENVISIKNCVGKVIHISAVPNSEMWKFIGAADVSMALIVPAYKSYYYALPNKLFEAIQSLTPVIISDLPEMKRIINKYDIGLVCSTFEEDEIMNSIIKIRDNKVVCERLNFNLLKAKEELTWENEKEVLKKAYSNLLNV